MENNRQKIVNSVFMGFAVLLGYIVSTVAQAVSANFDLEARFKSADLAIRGGSVLAGAILFLYLYRSDKANQYFNEAVVELGRVTWPGTNDTYKATFVVIIMVIIAGIFLGSMDLLWTYLLKWVTG